MRRPSPFVDRASSLDITMTPMIDVVFLLLVFFVWTASFQIIEQVLPSRLMAASGSQPATVDEPPPPEEDFDRIVVRVLWTPTGPAWRINDRPLASLTQTRAQLEMIAGIKRDVPVILHPDQDVPLGDVIDLYDLARLVGFDKIQFAASEPI
jgi:biopolymer transport protein ExbD